MLRAILHSSALLGVGRLVLAQAASAPQPYALRHVAVVDVVTGRINNDQTIIISGNRISIVGPSESVPVPAAATTIDAAGQYVIPGLWDMHAHTPGNAETRSVFIPLEVANGVTGIRHMWGTRVVLGQRADVVAGTLLGPRMVIGTPILDGPRFMWPTSISISTPERARAVVDSLAPLGYDFVKEYEFLGRDVYLAIAAEARRLKLPLAGHVPLEMSAGDASDAGQKSFEHSMGITLACSTDEAKLRAAFILAESTMPAGVAPHGALFARVESEPVATFSESKCKALAARFVANGSWIVPTLVLYRGRGSLPGSHVRMDSRLRFMSAETRAAFAGPPPMSVLDSIRPHLGRLALLMQRAGVGVLVGTDTPNPFVLPGFGVHDELALLVDAGFTPLEALQAATLNPARFLGVTDSLGTVAAGKLADLVVLDANPLSDIHNTVKIRAVVANGRFLDRPVLDAVLAGVERTVATAPAKR